MVELIVDGDALIVDVLGAHKVWALKSRLEVPLSNVEDVRARPDMRLGWWHGARLPGTHLPGVIVAGSYRKNGQWHFWDVRHPENTIEVTLAGHHYQKLFVEVADPGATMKSLRTQLPLVARDK